VDEVAARLSRQREVDGVVMMGSGGAGLLSPASDIDLLVVLEGSLQRVRMISTSIAGRLAEVYFIQTAVLDAWSGEPRSLPQESFAAVQLRWIESGQLLFDRTGRLARLQAALQAGDWSSAADDAEVYAAWFRINYDLAQTRRLVEAEDEIGRIKADLCLARMLVELWERYFVVRRLPALSEKGRIRWMQANDSRFLAAFQSCLAEADRERKFGQYVELARAVLGPGGGLWPEISTAVDLDGGGPEEAEQALRLWEDWLGEDQAAINKPESFEM
jgi:hypothetical protein